MSKLTVRLLKTTKALHAGATLEDKKSKLRKGQISDKKKSTARRCQPSAMGCLIKDKNLKRGIFLIKKKMHIELSLLIVKTALWTVNTYSNFQVNIFSNNRDITKCQSFCTTTTTLTTPRL